MNAQTLKNPFSTDRQRLVKLIAEHGSVEFLQEEFMDPQAQRKTPVEVALLHLKKVAEPDSVLNRILEGMDADESAHLENLVDTYDVAVAQGWAPVLVRTFDTAVEAARQSALAQVRADVCRARMGKTLEQMQAKEEPTEKRKGSFVPVSTAQRVRDLFAKEYRGLKNAAWAQVIRSTAVLEKASAKMQKNMESDFEQIKQLEFTEKNIYGFLQGLCESANEVLDAMICEVFDEITRYHEDNSVYFMGWKSNGLHRSAGMRIKRTRFILPGHTVSSYSSSADFDTCRLLSDFDKVTAALDGKQRPVMSLEQLFHSPDTFKRLCAGERLSASYFDVRYYRQRGTIHFFPRNMEVIERLNRTVGRLRQWLPPQWEAAHPDFKKQYDMAEALHAVVLKELTTKTAAQRNITSWDMAQAFRDKTTEYAHIRDRLTGALQTALDNEGLTPFAELNWAPPQQLALAA